MAVLEISREQIKILVDQLSPDEKRHLLIEIAEDAQTRRAERRAKGEAAMRQLCAERGLAFDAMTDEERIAFMDDLIHEGRACP